MVRIKAIVKIRDFRHSRRLALSTFLKELDWSILDTRKSCEDKPSTFESLVHSGMDILMTLKPMKIFNNEPARINPQLKSLKRQRQKALAKGHQAQFKILRNQVNRERKKCRCIFFRTKVNQLKFSKRNQR